MRFYKIALYETNKGKRGKLITPKSMERLNNKKWSYFSVDESGRVLHSALDLYLDIGVNELNQPRRGSAIRISGISLDDISQFTYLPDAEIEIYGGMLSGYLPLAHATTPDLLMRGTVHWATGNWEGVNKTIDMVFVPIIGLDPALREGLVKNFMFSWSNGQKLSEAIRETLERTYAKSSKNPEGYEVEIAISDDLVWQKSAAFIAYYPNLSKFAEELGTTTKENFPNLKTTTGQQYRGVSFKVFDKKITVIDRTKTDTGKWTKDNPMEIKFQDLIGQPTWKTNFTMSFKTVMRGDIEVFNWVKLPPKLAAPYVITSAGQGQAPNDEGGLGEPSKNKLAFQGAFEVVSIRHVGQFRQADAQTWVTVFEAQPFMKAKEVTPLTSTTTEPKPDQTGKAPDAVRSSPTSPFKKPPPPPDLTKLPPYQIHPPVLAPPTSN